MQLIAIRENAATVEFDWSDVKYLTYIIRHAIAHDVGSTASEPVMLVTYAETAGALLLAAGMASWAHTVDEEEFSLARFLEVVQVTPEDERRWRERVAEAQREHARKSTPPAA